ARRTAAAGLPLLVFCYGDERLPVPLPGAVVFRQHVHASRMLPTELVVPAWNLDPLADVADPGPRPYVSPPTVGFCGAAHPLVPYRRNLPARVYARAHFEARALITRVGLANRLHVSPGDRHREVAI